ncbi:hypothetical protein SAMN02745883_01628 [Caminicella sporogenes DSM 14501]|uniref:Damage-control phosphatase ARMT1-like metal-binding domain-containing protein n=1 Tax=Caminicella sporogenes DSM 14501 TaxID=1121266 RepID=A0A1M6QVT9_9FIRM|nr:ARMT1-like domain-containing protein [Caminicella sporogenes]RKD20894.1 hypothetical protein BET04_08660 [Caminicella sporogenes]SHK24198.1 hypothetical protein SAMN02745883_01628 [Caminicella sporogenes DSM 14501]
MKIYLDCIPCFFRQILEAARMNTNDEKLQKKILMEAVKIVANIDNYKTSPEIGRDMHKLVKKIVGIEDSYKSLKKRCIEKADKLYPDMKRFLYKQNDRLYTALKISVVGNIMDAAIYGEKSLEENFLKEFYKEFKICEIEKLREKLNKASKILIIGDNAGETVFDRILVEELSQFEVIYAVRSKPIINDVTIEEAYDSKLDYGAKIVSTGCDAPGVVLDECSEEFKKIYNSADVIISKGQGNYETLSDEGRGIFFLLKAKCPVVAKDIGVNVNDYVMFQK